VKGADEGARFVGFHLAADVFDRPQRLPVLGLGQKVEDVAL
jgi:hypothetical protein